MATAALLLWFAVRLLTLALGLAPGVPPDEADHLGRAQAFARSAWMPADSPATWQHGVIAHQPYLHPLLMGKLLSLKPASVSDLIYLRVVNAALAFATAVVASRWFGLVLSSATLRLLALTVLTNTLMFTGIGAALSYDNAVNLCAAGAVLAWFRYFRSRDPGQVLALVALLGAGCLSKAAFLPLAALLVAAFALREGRRVTALPAAVLGALRRPPVAALAVLALLLAGGTLQLYGQNWLRYGRLVPRPEQVLGVDAALHNRIAARNYLFRELREGRLSYEEAVRRAQGIRRPGDRRATLFLLQQARDPALLDSTRLNPVQYTGAWLYTVTEWVFGYASHRSLRRTTAEIAVYLALLGAAGVGFVRTARRSQIDLLWAAGLVFGYAMILMWAVNYPAYARSGAMWLAAQGRYLFPVWMPFCAVFAHYLITPLPARLQGPAAALVGAWFLAGDLPVLLSRAGPEWFPEAA